MWMGVVAAPAWADQVSGLYETQVLVSDQSTEARADSINRAFEEVLIKLSGDANVLHTLQGEPLPPASHFTQYYAYQQYDSQYQAWWLDADTVGQYTVLDVGFDRQMVNQALRDRGVGLWGQNRPGTLVWLALEDEGERDIISSRDEMADMLRQHAERRGLPLLLPLMDLEDTSQVNVSDIWGQFAEVTRAASQRYASDAILTAAIYAGHRGVWHARWSLYQGRQVTNWENSSDHLIDIVAAGIDTAADNLAAHYTLAQQNLTAQPAQIVISDIRQAKDYAAVTAYLSTLSPLSALKLVQVTPDALRFEAMLQGDENTLNQAVSIDDLLVTTRNDTVSDSIFSFIDDDEDDEEEGDDDMSTMTLADQSFVIHYRWSPS